MTTSFRVALGQVHAQVGDIDGNVARILEQWREANAAGCDLIVFTELAVPGYLPEDLLLKPEFVAANMAAVEDLAAAGPKDTVAVVGYARDGGAPSEYHQTWDVAVSTLDLHNSAAVLSNGRVAAVYDKWRLPNYGVFDEARYFVPEDDPIVVRVAGVPVGITICEDMWVDQGPLHVAAQAGARVIANLNASPWHVGKRAAREQWACRHAVEDSTWLLYCNVLGGQDDVVFDGDSMIVGPDGAVLARGAQFEEDLVIVDLPVEEAEAAAPDLDGFGGERPALAAHVDRPRLDPVAEVWQGVVRATRDYCHRNGFTDAIVGLSGGIDSAVTAAIAADALGGENVLGVLMPSPYSSDHSISDAQRLADNLGLQSMTIPINDGMKALDQMLADAFVGLEPDITEENIQARLRGITLMALSNKRRAIVLTTGNKSEYAVGYATLYGDMCGGFAPIKDVPKMLVYDLARHRASLGPSIPEGSLTKPPSAELRPGQLDQDTLPPYEILDKLIQGYVEQDRSIADLVSDGHDEAMVRHVVQLIDRAEYKRRQAPPGPKVTTKAFGRERRVPITSGWRG
ncbi:MAG: NAD+ synthase [Nitriliruptorales bacterium]|nr:NAD+ synthase [Nitriliruptorales bacterium]